MIPHHQYLRGVDGAAGAAAVIHLRLPAATAAVRAAEAALLRPRLVRQRARRRGRGRVHKRKRKRKRKRTRKRKRAAEAEAEAEAVESITPVRLG